MKALVIFFIALILISEVLAIDCSTHADEELCEQILDSDLPDDEQEELIELFNDTYEDEYISDWQTETCEPEFEDLEISIITDKLIYKPNETIKVEINPSDREFIINYAEKSYPATGTLELEAIYPYNKISITYDCRAYDKIIHVKNETNSVLLYSITFFGIANYVIMNLLKKYWGVVL